MKKIDIETILNSPDFNEKFQIENLSSLHILKDACSLKRIPLTNDSKPLLSFSSEGGEHYRFFLTKRVAGEINKLRQLNLIPWQLSHFIYALVADVIDPEVSRVNFSLIQNTNFASARKAGKRGSSMGIVDIQMLSYAIERARQGKQTLIISDDSHLLRSTEWLRSNNYEKETFKKNIFTFGLQKPVQALYPHIDPKQFPCYVN